MNESKLNSAAYDLVGRIEAHKKEQDSAERTGSLSQLQFEDWSSKRVPGPSLIRTPNTDFSANILSIELDGVEYSFKDKDYPAFTNLTNELLEDIYLNRSVSIEFIEETCMLWIVNVHLRNQSELDLINYLRSEAESEIEQVTYYFHVLNLHIHQPFRIGNIELTFFTEEYFDRLWLVHEKKNHISKEGFDKLYRKYQGWVFTSYEVKAENRKGRQIAFIESCLSLDALRCFAPTLMIPDRHCYMDLAERINVNFQTDSISIPKGSEGEIRLSKLAKHDPIRINKEYYEQLLKMGLGTFSELIAHKESSELSKLLVQSISLFSYSISTFDLHLRVIQLVTIFESLLLEENQKDNMEESVKKRVTRLLNVKNEVDLQRMGALFSDMYQVRHKMAHKARRLPIDMKKLGEFQFTAIQTLKRLCELRNTIKDKDSLIQYLA